MKLGKVAFAGIALVATLASNASEAPLSVRLTPPPMPQADGFKMGTATNPAGETITIDSQSLLLNGKPWTPVMGEFHFSRTPANEWREELLKIKAGGIDIVATYIFWIHHEEIEGEFDWSERRNLRRFIELCGEVGLKAIVRCGPWCHGEVRNGGQPDWLLKKGWRLRSDDPAYLEKTRILYGEIANQLSGLLWKDGGPVIGVQFENEYRGPASHLMTLKKIGLEAGLDVPIYTRTGWPELRTPMPFGEVVPLYGVYAEGFWDRELTPMPGRYWSGFHFSTLRRDANIANEILGRTDAADAADVARYPYLTCEVGGGMMNSYHRRILIDPADIESTTLVKLGSGSTSPGYYMYHGGVNPEGKLTTLQESQATGYPNDLPVKSYDFQAPLGEYNQLRPYYHSLRRLHLFLDRWGSSFARMGVSLPDQRPGGQNDTSTMRWAVRSDGTRGYVFVNNYERLRSLPEKKNVQFKIARQNGGDLIFPDRPVTVAANARFFWPFGMALNEEIILAWATAQPVTAVDVKSTRTVFFAQAPDVAAEFAFDGKVRVKVESGKVEQRDGRTIVCNVKPGRGAAFTVSAGNREVRVVLLSDADSLAVWKANWRGAERVFLSSAGLVFDGDTLRLSSRERDDLAVGIYPAPERISSGQRAVAGRRDGIFQSYSPERTPAFSTPVSFEPVRSAGPAREVRLGNGSKPVALAPEDQDFENAAVWRVQLPRDIDLKLNPILSIGYVGDVARVLLNGKLQTDDFYNGRAFEIGLARHAPEILEGTLEIAILPLRRDAPIYMAEQARPQFGNAESIATLRSVTLIPNYTAELKGN